MEKSVEANESVPSDVILFHTNRAGKGALFFKEKSILQPISLNINS